MGDNVALVTARGGSQSIFNKNVLKIAGKPALAYPILAAKEAARIAHVFVLTDCPRIKKVAGEFGATIINRPAELVGPNIHHGDAICYGVEQIVQAGIDPRIVTVLLGNTVMITPDLIDLSIEILESSPDWDSAMSVFQAQDNHPYRAMLRRADGSLTSFLRDRGFSEPIHNTRQSYPPVYYYDQGVWTFRSEVASKREGPEPWWWMGKRVFPIVRHWVAGRDFHSGLDVDLARWWLDSGQVDEICNLSEIGEVLRGSRSSP